MLPPGAATARWPPPSLLPPDSLGFQGIRRVGNGVWKRMQTAVSEQLAGCPAAPNIHRGSNPSSLHPPCSPRCLPGEGCSDTHPAWGRSSPRGPGGTRGCWARRGGAGRIRRAAGWPGRRAGAGAGAPRCPRGAPRRRGSRCPGHCCCGRREGMRDAQGFFLSIAKPPRTVRCQRVSPRRVSN